MERPTSSQPQPSSSQSQSSPATSLQKDAALHPILTPSDRPQAATPVSEALVRCLITEANAMLAHPSTLGRWPASGVPLASDMSDDDIAEAIARSVDPSSLDLHGAERPQPVSLPVATLLTAMELGILFATDTDARALFAPGAMTVFVISEVHLAASKR